jgi:hypothetical protein
MKTAVVSMPLRGWLLKKPAWLDHQTEVGLIFVVKTFAASLLALSTMVVSDRLRGLALGEGKRPTKAH